MAEQVTSASAILKGMLEQWGIADLYTDAMALMKQGLSNDAITLQLQDTATYKKRFKGNEERVKNGLQALSPAEYVQLETQYKSLARQYGLPPSFYDTPDDLAKYIAGDVAPQEFNERLTAWQKTYQDDRTGGREALERLYGPDGGLAAFMDPDRAMPIVDRMKNAVTVAAAADRQQVDINRQQAEYLATLGVDASKAQDGFSKIGQRMDTEAATAERFGSSLSQDEQIQDEFGGLASAKRKRDQLNASERALFDGRTATTSSGLGSSSVGSF